MSDIFKNFPRCKKAGLFVVTDLREGPANHVIDAEQVEKLLGSMDSIFVQIVAALDDVISKLAQMQKVCDDIEEQLEDKKYRETGI